MDLQILKQGISLPFDSKFIFYNNLLFMTKSNFLQRPRFIECYENDEEDKMIIPFYMYSLKNKEFFKKIKINHNIPIEVNYNENYLYKIPLRKYQEELVDKILKAWENQMGRAYLELATGKGKTRIAVALIYYLKISTLIVVPTIRILKQWNVEIEKHGNAIDYIKIFCANTIRKKELKWFNEFDFIIYDELHLYQSCKNLLS